MGTPASVVSSSSVTQSAPEPRLRKKASANIFKDLDLFQIETLFRTNGDECAEERARIICEYAGDRRIAEALIHLRRKKKGKGISRSASKPNHDPIGNSTVQNFSRLCISEGGHRGSTGTEDDSDQQSSNGQGTEPNETKKGLTRPRKMKNKLRKKTKKQRSDYLHQIQ